MHMAYSIVFITEYVVGGVHRVLTSVAGEHMKMGCNN